MPGCFSRPRSTYASMAARMRPLCASESCAEARISSSPSKSFTATQVVGGAKSSSPLVLVAADVAVLRLRGVVVVALHGVAVFAVFVEVEGAVAVPAAQRGDDLLQRLAGAFIVAAHHIGDGGVLGLLVDGLEQRLEALPLLGGNGHHPARRGAAKGPAQSGWMPRRSSSSMRFKAMTTGRSNSISCKVR